MLGGKAMIKGARSFLTRTQRRQVIIVTGLSGAGKTSVTRALEDFGFYCVDNLPVPLLSTFLEFSFRTQFNLLKVAVGIDVRSQHFSDDMLAELEKIKMQLADQVPIELKIIYLHSSNEVIMKRFQETRRKHPLSQGVSMEQAIEKEKKQLAPVRERADIVLDTDQLNIHDLRKWVRTTFSHQQHEMVVNVISFGFKYGVPTESSMVFDIRFLPNPYFVPDLRPQAGTDKAVASYLFEQKDVQECWEQLITFIRYSIGRSYEEGRFFANVAIGCTGGRHRSVAFVERLAREEWEGIRFVIHHRDLERDPKRARGAT